MDRRFELAVTVKGADRQHRWGQDEASPGDVPKGLNFSTSDPGGFKAANLGLARQQDDWPDLRMLRDVEIYGAGNVTAWEGRLNELPAHFGGDSGYSPGAVGHFSELDDDPSFTEIYIDRDLTKWEDPSIQRRLNIALAKVRYQGEASVVNQDAGAMGPGLLHKFTRRATTAEEPSARVESWYYGGGTPLGEVRYDAVNPEGSGIAPADVNWNIIMRGSSDDLLTASDASKDYDGTTANGEVLVLSAGRKYLSALTQYNIATTTDGDRMWLWRYLRVFGRHGLTKYGTSAATQGLLGSDMVADIFARCAPGLNFTTGSEGSIRTSTNIIPQMAFPEPIKGSEAVAAINAYEQRSYGVYDKRQAFWLPTDVFRKRWRVRRSMGHEIDLLGPQADSTINGVVVTFTDPAGVRRYVGPPGTNGIATSELLVDASPENLVNQAGIARKWAMLDLSFVTTVEGAIACGLAYMREQLRNATSRGSVVVKGMVEDENGVLYPPWAMRACDSVTATDGDGIERRVIETNYDHDPHTNTANLDSTPHRFEEMLEWMGMAVRGLTD